MASGASVRLDRLSFTYRGAVRPALCDVSLEVGAGELVVVLGATGAGKSTLAKCLARIVPIFQAGRLEGEVRIDGQSMEGCGPSEVAGVVGLVSQDFEAQLFATNVAHEVAFGMEQLGVPRAEMERRLRRALELVGLTGFERRDPVSLSGGEKQRLAIAAVLALEPRLFVFDEPTTDLDPVGKFEVFAALGRLRESGFTIVLVEHEVAAAEGADRVLLMSEGRVVADEPPARLLPQVERLERFGVRPGDLDRLARGVGRAARFRSVAEAAAELGPRVRASAPRPLPSPSAEAPILVVDGVGYAYEDGPSVLADVSLTIGRGEFVALIGQNGSGKTTLAKHLNGLLRPSHGTVCLDGRDLRTLGLNRVASDVGYVFQNPDQQIFAASVREEVEFALVNLGFARHEVEGRARFALEAVGLVGLDGEDPFLLGKGQRQRLAVASLLALGPRVLILDEPTTGLDYPEQKQMMELLRRLNAEGVTLVVITHSPWVVAEYAERGILLRAGRVVFDGALRELFARSDLLESCRFRVPDATRLGSALGLDFTPLSVAEVLACLEAAPA